MLLRGLIWFLFCHARSCTISAQLTSGLLSDRGALAPLCLALSQNGVPPTVLSLVKRLFTYRLALIRSTTPSSAIDTICSQKRRLLLWMQQFLLLPVVG
jgi:hypothetical protein